MGGNIILLNNYVIPYGGKWHAADTTFVSGDTFTPIAPGKHMVYYTFSDSLGCVGIDSSIVTVHSLPVVFAGTVFPE